MRWLAGVAAIIAAVVDVLYYGFVGHQGGHDPLGWRVAFVATFIALPIFLGGFEVTEHAIACPAKGVETGSGSGLLSGPYHYTCVNGKLTMYPGACNSGGATVDASGNVISVSTC